MGLPRVGKEAAQQWAKDLRSSVEKTLKIFPLGQPLAPESEDAPFEIRQMLVGRYRVLYVVKEKDVTILHIRGAFAGKIEDDDQ